MDELTVAAMKKKLLCARNEAGLTRDDVVERTKGSISRTTLYRYETLGYPLPKTKNYQLLADVYGIPLDLLMNPESQAPSRGDGSGVCTGAQRVITKEPLRSESFYEVVAIPVLRYSELMSQGSDNVKPCDCMIFKASLFAGKDLDKIRVIDQDVSFKMASTGPIESGHFAVIDYNYKFANGYIYLVKADGISSFYRVIKTPDGSLVLSDDTSSRILPPDQQKEHDVSILAVVRMEAPKSNYRILCDV